MTGSRGPLAYTDARVYGDNEQVTRTLAPQGRSGHLANGVVPVGSGVRALLTRAALPAAWETHPYVRRRIPNPGGEGGCPDGQHRSNSGPPGSLPGEPLSAFAGYAP